MTESILDDAQLDQQIEKARQATALNQLVEPRAKAAFYDRDRHQIIIHLTSGATFSFPVQIAQGIADANPTDLAELELTPMGDGLHWETLDADLSIPQLLAGRFGSVAWMQQLHPSRSA